MSIHIMSQVWRSGCYDGGTLLVLQAMADWADDEGHRIFPKVATLAAKARLSERATQYALARLLKDGVLLVVARAQGHRPTEYRIDVDALRQVQSAAPETGVQNLRPADAAPLGVQSATDGVQPAAPPINNHQSQPLENPPSAGAREMLALDEGSSKTKSKSGYPSAFERWWSECRKWPGFSPNMSKPDALKAWQQCENARPSTGDMVQAAIEYRRWLEAENETRARRRDKPHPTLHPATWLRQKRWTGFLEAAALRLVENDPPRRITLAPQHVEALRNVGVSEVIVATWFADGEYHAGAFLAATHMKRDWIANHYARELAKAFGAGVTITVRQETKSNAA
jgi:hypothetical protein